MSVAHRDPAKLARQRTKVLMVDDRNENLVALEAILKPLGLDAIRAMSGEEALRLLLKHEVAVILLDVQMPGMDGFETAQYIKQVEKTRHIPIIFLTAISKESRNVFKGYSAGAVDYIFKPFDPVVLRSKVMVFVDLYEKSRALADSEERFHKAFEHAPIGVGLMRPTGEWLTVNDAMCRMTGHPRLSFGSLSIHDLMHPDDDRIELAPLMGELAEAGRPFEVERRLVGPDGRLIHALISISLVRPSAGEPYFIVQVNDFTERKRVEDFRNRFIANAAHELRTPAAVIHGTATLLHGQIDAMSPDDLETCVRNLNRQSSRLTQMINALLDLARLEEGRFEVVPEAVDVAEAISQVTATLPVPVGKELKMLAEPGIVARVDRRAFEQMVTNLVVNAFRYGGPTVAVTAESQNGRGVLVSVTDDGDGVPVDVEDRLFEPFVRGKRSVKVGGSGLGLALVKSLADANDASVSYERVDPKGARFVLSLAAAG